MNLTRSSSAKSLLRLNQEQRELIILRDRLDSIRLHEQLCEFFQELWKALSIRCLQGFGTKPTVALVIGSTSSTVTLLAWSRLGERIHLFIACSIIGGKRQAGR